MNYTTLILMDIDAVAMTIKRTFENTITQSKFNGSSYQNGQKAKEALIRSQQLINLIHEHVKQSLIDNGVNKELILPPLMESKPELKIEGFLKTKNQDICVIPKNETDPNKILSINVRSQLSSMQKNIDTLYERTFAEALNLHLSYPSQCLGEVYMIPTHEYDDRAMIQNRVSYKKVSKLEHYIQMFQAINLRSETDGDEYKYERVALVIVDFRPEKPVLYQNTAELINDGLLDSDSPIRYEGLDLENFTKDLLGVYYKRFGKIIK